ncbi:hypothetical protein [Ruegeria marina]|uniref:Uncharacterized protein n=1 Tax=Ruegeria marina TaxID=639004 RepID=A0A1G6LXC1_9RHOB|nr:hypothetical protein [Ruegeria marina]SDC47714.1 hypothetical protein SAMN04488239_102347 [Ruegeria marina]
MQILVGVAGLSLAVLVYAWAYGLAHDPMGPKWAKGQLFASVASLVSTSLAPVGAGFLAAGLLWPDDLGITPGLAIGAAMVPTVWVLSRRLLRRAIKEHSVIVPLPGGPGKPVPTVSSGRLAA